MSHQIDIEKVRADFPILSRKVNGHPLVYFDNAATSQTKSGNRCDRGVLRTI